MEDGLSELLQAVRVDNACCLHAELSAPWGCCRESSPHALIYICVDGTAHLTIAAPQAVVLHPGDCAVVAHGSAHTLKDSPSSPALARIPDPDIDPATGLPTIRCGGGGGKATLIALELQLDRVRARPLLRVLPPLLHIPGEDGQLPSWARPLAQASDIEILRRGPGSAATLIRLAEMLFIQLVRAAAESFVAEVARGAHQGQWSAPVIHAIRLIREQPGRRWSVATLAAQVGMSRSAFAATFAREMDEPPMQYLATQRMLLAADLLKTPDIAVAEVAFLVGYESDIAFARGFKRHHGIGPGAYRRGARLSRAADGAAAASQGRTAPEPQPRRMTSRPRSA
ncbi:MAG: AraC family transcriptional regulator [Pseudomonadota bacterium]